MTNQITISLDQPLRQARTEFERLYFEHHAAQAGSKRGAKNKLAELTGMDRTAVYRRLRKFGMNETVAAPALFWAQ